MNLFFFIFIYNSFNVFYIYFIYFITSTAEICVYYCILKFIAFIFKYLSVVCMAAIRYVDHAFSLSLSLFLALCRTRLQRNLYGMHTTEISHTHRCSGWQHSQHFINCCCQILLNYQQTAKLQVTEKGRGQSRRRGRGRTRKVAKVIKNIW